LKQAVVDKFARENNLNYSLNQILVSCGAKHSIFNLFSAVLNPGDEVIIPAPYWVSYPDIAKLCDAVPVIIKAEFEQNYKITPEQLQAAITPKTRLVLLNSPSNPTGVAYTAAELKALGDVLLQFPDVLIVSDDIYEHTLWTDEPFVNILMVCPGLYDRCIVVNGVSKAYAMTGWRIGYAAGPASVIKAMTKIQSQSTSNATSIAQVAAQAALNGDQSCITVMTKAFKDRHDYVLGELRKINGVRCSPCDGTFYIFPCFNELIANTAAINNDIELAEYLLNEAEIALIPGSAFGAEGYLRISYATSMDKLIEAMQRMQAALAKL
jgi:aspartate aminotransferase